MRSAASRNCAAIRDVVGADHGGSLLDRRQRRELRDRIALGQPPAEEPLARGADQDGDRREPRHQLLEPRQHLPAVRRLQAQELAPAGVDHDLVGVDAGRERHVDAGRQPVGHVADHVAIVGGPVGGVRQRPVLGVHHDQDRAQVADHGRHRGIGAQGRDVVDDRGAERDAALGRGGMIGVDRQHGLAGQGPHHRLQPCQLVVARDRPAAGGGRFTAQVEQMRSVRDQARGHAPRRHPASDAGHRR